MGETWDDMIKEMEYVQMVDEVGGVLNVDDELLTEEDLKVKRYMLEKGLTSDYEHEAYWVVVVGLTLEEAKIVVRKREEDAWEDSMRRWAED